MDLGIRGKTALVLGAGGGIGGAVARTLAAEGVTVAAVGRTADSLNRVAGEIINAGGRASAHVLDLTDIGADIGRIDTVIGAIETRHGPVNILFNNTGGPPPTPAAGQDADLWQAQFQAMVLSVIKITDRVLPGMRAGGWGRIITSTSSGVVAPIANLGISNGLRSALLGWSKTLAREVAGDGITANIVVPGRIATARTADIDSKRAAREGRTVEAVAGESAASIPVGRYGTPEEYAAMVAFLASAQASYVTGSVIRVDGGYIPGI